MVLPPEGEVSKQRDLLRVLLKMQLVAGWPATRESNDWVITYDAFAHPISYIN